MQVRLLRVLEAGRFSRIGADQEIATDVRVIAASNRDLRAAVAAGKLREDLMYRLCVIPVSVPPLRERGSDIAELSEHFIRKYCAETGRTIAISAPAMRLLENYSWPGNVRELEHAIERAVALERTGLIQPERLPEQITNYSQTRRHHRNRRSGCRAAGGGLDG